MKTAFSISPIQGLGVVASPLHKAMPADSILFPFRAMWPSPEGAVDNSEAATPLAYNDGYRPSEKKTSPEGAIYAKDGCKPIA